MTTTYKKLLTAIAVFALISVAFFVLNRASHEGTAEDLHLVTLSGVYVCLPHQDTTGPQTEECAFGLRADDGVYYAVNFGASAGALEQFRSGEYIRAEGFVVPKEALSSNHWALYNMKGIFTVTKFLEVNQVTSQGKLNINTVCEGALAYMTFPDAKSADLFVAECKEGKYPEVIERYKADMNLGDGAAY